MRIALPSIAIGLLLTSTALSEEAGRNTLKGLDGIAVLVDVTADLDGQRSGLTRSTLTTDIELRLRQSGIRVLSERESRTTLSGAFLALNLGAIQTQVAGLYAYALKLELFQNTTLLRDRSIPAVAAMWETWYVGSVGSSRLAQVRESVRDLVDSFINDYLAVNPKR